MDTNRGDSYYSPAEDENTAIERSMMNLRDIEVRCMRAAPMCYASSSECEETGFKIKCVGTAVSGGMSLLTGFAGSAAVENYFKIHILQSKYLIGAGMGIVTFFGMVKAIDSVIGAWYDEKAQKYNEAAAEWQKLEIRIKAFLAAAVRGTITAEDCKLFTEECAEKRKQICLIARPYQKVYKKYESDSEFVINRLKNIQEFNQKRRENHLFSR